ncbi:MAG: hypothetical protein HRU21_10640 [Pseudomonadales bacterium]|nr:hypothetical protein [Pseudomonadales bacterium]
MIVRPWVLDEQAKAALAPSMGPITWDEVEAWLSDYVACVWRIGLDAWALTFANSDNEIEFLAAGGSGAWKAMPIFDKAMRNLPEHAGKTFRIEGRKGWARLLPDWTRKDLDGGSVLLTFKV